MATIVDEPAYLSVSQGALRLGLSTPTIRRKIATGELPAVQLGAACNSPVRIASIDLDC
jgi:excisionase family DNA binding protein